jgi:hypothetical protein
LRVSPQKKGANPRGAELQHKQEVAIMLKNEWSGNIVAEAAWEDGKDLA